MFAERASSNNVGEQKHSSIGTISAADAPIPSRDGAGDYYDDRGQRCRWHFHLCSNWRQDWVQLAVGVHYPGADGVLRAGDDGSFRCGH